jgi:hypothetical protein
LVYADWLDEHGDARGEYLRIQGKLLETARERKNAKEVQETSWELKSWLEANSPDECRRKQQLLKEGKLKLVAESAYCYGRRRLSWLQLTSPEQHVRVQKLLEAAGGGKSAHELQARFKDLYSREPPGHSPEKYPALHAMLLAAAGGGKSTKELQTRYKELRLSIDPIWLQATDWPEPKRVLALRCMFGHSWDGCVCSRCESVSNDDMRHAWVGCRCIRCGQTTEAIVERFLTLGEFESGEHELVGCQCSICGAVRHDWKVVSESGGGYIQERLCTRCSATQIHYPQE